MVPPDVDLDFVVEEFESVVDVVVVVLAPVEVTGVGVDGGVADSIGAAVEMFVARLLAVVLLLLWVVELLPVVVVPVEAIVPAGTGWFGPLLDCCAIWIASLMSWSAIWLLVELVDVVPEVVDDVLVVVVVPVFAVVVGDTVDVVVCGVCEPVVVVLDEGVLTAGVAELILAGAALFALVEGRPPR